MKTSLARTAFPFPGPSNGGLTPRRSVLLLLTLAAGSLSGSGSAAAQTEDADSRTAWKYNIAGKTVVMKRVAEGVWMPQRADGRKITYREVTRTEDYIELKKPDTNFQLRLFAGRSQFRKGDSEKWKNWWKGVWVDAEGEPAVAATEFPDRYEVRLAYFVPSDRRPVKDYADKIRVVMAFVAEFYASDLKSKGYQTDGIRFESQNGKPVVHLIEGSKRANFYNNSPQFNADVQWTRLAPEIKKALGKTNQSVVAVFAETQNRGRNPDDWPGNIARGAFYNSIAGRAVFGAVSLRPEFCANALPQQMALLRRMTPKLRQVTLTRYGAIAHELGHAFGLGHDRRQDNLYIMGNGFRNLVRNLEQTGRVQFSEESALLLMSSRYLAKDLKLGDNVPPEVELKLEKQANRVFAVVKATDAAGLRAVVFVDRKRATVIGGSALNTNSVEIRQELPRQALNNGAPEIMVKITDQGGNVTKVTETAVSAP